jgi:hypothetical protein
MTKVRTRGEPKHGTATEYASYGCRCKPCREAHLRAYKTSRDRARERFHNGEIEVKHGTNNTYLYYNCRCDECKAAHTATYNAQEAKKRAKREAEAEKNGTPLSKRGRKPKVAGAGVVAATVA